MGLIFYGQPRDESSAGNRINVILFVMCCFSLFCLPAISRYFEERLTFVPTARAIYLSSKSFNSPLFLGPTIARSC